MTFYIATEIKGVIVSEVEADTEEDALAVARGIKADIEYDISEGIGQSLAVVGTIKPSLIDTKSVEVVDFWELVKKEYKKLGKN